MCANRLLASHGADLERRWPGNSNEQITLLHYLAEKGLDAIILVSHLRYSR